MTFSRKRLKFDEERLTHESTGNNHMQLIDTGVHCALDPGSTDNESFLFPSWFIECNATRSDSSVHITSCPTSPIIAMRTEVLAASLVSYNQSCNKEAWSTEPSEAIHLKKRGRTCNI